MQITLKKVLFCGIGILAALFFFLVAFMPVSRTITTVIPGSPSSTVTGSLMGVLSGDANSIAMVKSQINLSDYLKGVSDLDPEAYARAVKNFQAAQDAMVSMYKVFAVLAIVLFVASLLALIGGFFMKTIKGTRKLGIPFLAIDLVLSMVVMIFAIIMTLSTDMAITGVTYSANTTGPVLMYLLGIVMFIAMLVASGVVKEKVLVGKKN